MTPIASQEPSRTRTPVRASAPICCLSSSRPTTPRRCASSSVSTESANCNVTKERELSEKELQIQTRRKITMLDTQLGKTNIAAWASMEDGEKDAPFSFQTVPVDHQVGILFKAMELPGRRKRKPSTWPGHQPSEFNEEEIKIQAWKNHQKAKSEAGMRKIEVEVERMQACAHDKFMIRLESMRHKAEEKSAVPKAKRNKLQEQHNE